MTNDMSFAERNEFHDWYKNKYGEEYPHTYSETFKVIAEAKKAERLIEEYKTEAMNMNNKPTGQYGTFQGIQVFSQSRFSG